MAVADFTCPSGTWPPVRRQHPQQALDRHGSTLRVSAHTRTLAFELRAHVQLKY